MDKLERDVEQATREGIAAGQLKRLEDMPNLLEFVQRFNGPLDLPDTISRKYAMETVRLQKKQIQVLEDKLEWAHVAIWILAIAGAVAWGWLAAGWIY